jgi:endo-alpha-1,4-polygalactosaminidase (GH114 family)
MSQTFATARENYMLNVTAGGTLVVDRISGAQVLVPFGQEMNFDGVVKFSKDTQYMVHHVHSHLESYEPPQTLVDLPIDFLRTGSAWTAGSENYNFSDRRDKVVVAYINMTEFTVVGGWDPSFNSAWDANGDHLIDGGVSNLPAYVDTSVYNAAWHNYVAAYWTQAWRDQLKSKIDAVMSQNFDGIMLDVMNNAHRWKEAYPSMNLQDLQAESTALVRWISDYVKSTYGTAAVVSGNLDPNFYTYFPDLGQHVDVGYYQNAYFDWDGSGTVPSYALTSTQPGTFTNPSIDFLKAQGMTVLDMEHLGTGPVTPGLDFINYDDRITTENYERLFEWAIDSGSTPYLAPVFFGTPYAQAPHFVRLYEGDGTHESTGHWDWIIGSSAADQAKVGAGDYFHGGDGVDAAILASTYASYTRAGAGADALTITRVGTSETLRVREVERLVFSDLGIAFDLDGAAGSVARLLGAVFGPAATTNTFYVGIGLSLFDGGMEEAAVAALALDARLGADASNEAVVSLLYMNLVGAAPPAAVLADFSTQLAGGAMTRSQLVQFAAHLDLNESNIGLVGLAAAGLVFSPST